MHTRRARLAVAVLTLALVGAGCGVFSLNTTKRVVGESTGPFTVSIECVVDTPPPSFPAVPESDTLTFDTFDVNGEQTIESTEFDLVPFSTVTCEVSETDTAGASSVTIACVDPLPTGFSCTGPGEPITVTAPLSTNSEADFTVNLLVTNTFDPSTPTTPTTAPASNTAAEAVTAQPNTTG